MANLFYRRSGARILAYVLVFSLLLVLVQPVAAMADWDEDIVSNEEIQEVNDGSDSTDEPDDSDEIGRAHV